MWPGRAGRAATEDVDGGSVFVQRDAYDRRGVEGERKPCGAEDEPERAIDEFEAAVSPGGARLRFGRGVITQMIWDLRQWRWRRKRRVWVVGWGHASRLWEGAKKR